MRQVAGRRLSACAPRRRAPHPGWLLPATAVVFAIAQLFWFPAQSAMAQQPVAETLHSEYAVKAVLLYSFGRYIEWPTDAFTNASDPFVIGILGEDPFTGALDEIATKRTIQGRRIVIRRFASVEAYHPPCHILFVSRSLTSDQQAAVIAKTEGKPVFVIGETPGFAERGATANFFTEGDRILFEINVDTARRAQLRMDAKLLSLGRPVDTQRAATN